MYLEKTLFITDDRKKMALCMCMTNNNQFTGCNRQEVYRLEDKFTTSGQIRKINKHMIKQVSHDHLRRPFEWWAENFDNIYNRKPPNYLSRKRT